MAIIKIFLSGGQRRIQITGVAGEFNFYSPDLKSKILYFDRNHQNGVNWNNILLVFMPSTKTPFIKFWRDGNRALTMLCGKRRWKKHITNEANFDFGFSLDNFLSIAVGLGVSLSKLKKTLHSS